MQTCNIMIVGVGGQGTLLASRILGELLLSQGFDVKVSEVHGMSQRGGSVVTYVRYGEQVCSPVIDKGEADYILSFELLEGARWLPFLKVGGTLLTSTQQIDPMPVVSGVMDYPAALATQLSDLGVSLCAVDALSAAQKAGSAKAVNVVMLGLLSRRLPFSKECWLSAIHAAVPEKIRALNLAAFALGEALAE